MNGSTYNTEEKQENSFENLQEHFQKTQLIPFCVIMVVGFFANTMVIVNGIRRRSTIGNYNYFVLSTAVADLGVVLTQVPLLIFEFTLGIPNVSDFTCKYIMQIRETFQGGAVFSISFLALVRVRKVMNGLVEELSQRTYVILVVGVWLLSFFSCTLPSMFVYEVDSHGNCNAEWRNEKVMQVHVTFIYCILLSPMVIATISYTTVIIRALRILRSSDMLRGRNRNFTILLISLIVSCWISYFPIAVYFMLHIHGPDDIGFYPWSITTTLFLAGSAINPVLVLVTLPHDYRCRLHCVRRQRVGFDVPVVQTADLNQPVQLQQML